MRPSMKMLVVAAVLALLAVACSDDTADTTEPAPPI